MRAIVFDLGGVVFDYAPARRLTEFAALTGLPEAEVQKRLFDSGFSASCDAGRVTGAAIYAEAARLLGTRFGRARFRETWISAFTPNRAVTDRVAELKADYAVALLTNNSDLVRDGLLAAYPDTMALFRPLFFSCDIGVLKPHPRMFETVLDIMNVEPADVLFIDDAAKHVSGARSLGLNAIHYQGPERLATELARHGLA